MKLTLIRHTSLQVPAGICYGQSDIDVAASFLDEVVATRAKIAHQKFDAVYTSPLQRCVKLAHALEFSHAIEDARLKELHFGDWEMQAWNDLPREYFDEWAQNYADMAPPNGETFTQLQQRGVEFLTELMKNRANQSVLVVTHGGMIRALLAHVLNMQLKGLFRFQVDYGSITQLDFSGLAGGGVPKVNFVNL